MSRHALLRSLSVAALPLLSPLGCGRSHDGETKSPAPAEPAPSVASTSPAPASPPRQEVPRPSAQADSRAPGPQGIDRQKPVATVNGTPILAERVYSIYRMNVEMLQQRGRTLNGNDDQALRAQSLEVVIAEELLYRAALATGITVSASEIDAAVKQVKARAGSEEAYKRFLVEARLSELDVRREVERDLQSETYRKSLVAGQGVSEDQARKFYDANVPKGMFNVPEQVHVQYILVKVNEKDPESVRIDARKRADEAAKRAVAGEDFTALAKEYSQDATAARGGDIGLFPRGVMFPKFEEIAFAGKPGDVTPVFETPKGFNVMKILEKKPESTRTFDEVKNALMLDMGRLMEQDIVRAKIQELAAGAKIAILDPAFARPAPPATATNAAPSAKP
jgi:peptidyl-prolyl cis-trans isomerase C